jgi:phosphatidylglycerophosphatase C
LKKIAFFDFDGTITTKDTLLEFIKFSKGTFRFYIGFLINSPYLVAYKLKIITNQKAKEKVLQFFFRNTALNDFNRQCEAFAKNALPQLLRPAALSEIEKLKKEGSTVVIVSASPENWLEKWTQQINANLLSTKLEIKDGKLTGNILGKNCHGEEKVRRIKEAFNLSEFEVINAYGDSSGDRPMLSLATAGFYKPFRE